jgi:hypothetical protein
VRAQDGRVVLGGQGRGARPLGGTPSSFKGEGCQEPPTHLLEQRIHVKFEVEFFHVERSRVCFEGVDRALYIVREIIPRGVSKGVGGG